MNENGIDLCKDGISYYRGINGFPLSYENAFKCFIESSKLGNSVAEYYAGYMFTYGQGVKQDVQRGYQLFLRSAEKGNMYSEFELGKFFYHDGNGTPANIDEAYKHFIKSAKSGNAYAAAYAGDICLNVYKKYDVAYSCYCTAAKANNAVAYQNLGYICELGQGPTPGDNYAVKYYEEAAKLGSVFSLYAAGRIYYRNGFHKKAYEYLQTAANKGHEPSRKLLKLLRI